MRVVRVLIKIKPTNTQWKWKKTGSQEIIKFQCKLKGLFICYGYFLIKINHLW